MTSVINITLTIFTNFILGCTPHNIFASVVVSYFYKQENIAHFITAHQAERTH